ncbi:MAG: SIS domain-containing protein [Chloroflexota bacterium]
MNAALTYLEEARKIIDTIESTQAENIETASRICTESIANDALVNLFGTGHSRMFVEEMFPRHGSYTGYHSMVELSLTFHNQVVGSNGQRQAMFLEKVEGLGKTIMRNFVFAPPDSFMIFSNSGVNEVVVEVALEAKAQSLPVIAVVSMDHSMNSTPRHSSGKRLPEIADVTIDNCVPAGDAMVTVDGLEDPVGPGSTIGAATVTNMIKCRVAELLTALGKPPLVLSSSYFLGSEKAAQRFDACYDEYRERMKRVYG